MKNDMFGYIFGRLTVLGPVCVSNWIKTYCCACECGRYVYVRRGNLTSGNSTSCGCLKTQLQTTHGKTGTREYAIWDNMRRRCTDPTNPQWDNYGGRGITVCREWLSSFDAFWQAMQDGYAPHLTIERIDVNGNYEPSNCTWATRSQQNQSKRKLAASSIYRGVTATRGKWMAQIMKDKKRKYLGLFESDVDAAKSYDAAALEMFGASAALNFPEAKKNGGGV